MHWPLRHHAGIEFDFAEGILVSRDVLLQHSEQGLGLLRAQIDALKILDLDLGFALLDERAEHQEEVPDIHANLHAVGIVFTIVGSIGQSDGGLSRIRHRDASVAVLWLRKKAATPLTTEGTEGTEEAFWDKNFATCGFEVFLRVTSCPSCCLISFPGNNWLARKEEQSAQPSSVVLCVLCGERFSLRRTGNRC